MYFIFDAGQSCLDIGGNNKDLDKTIICKIVLESFTYLLNEFKYINKKTCYHKIYFPDKYTFKSSLVRKLRLGDQKCRKSKCLCARSVFFGYNSPLDCSVSKTELPNSYIMKWLRRFSLSLEQQVLMANPLYIEFLENSRTQKKVPESISISVEFHTKFY